MIKNEVRNDRVNMNSKQMWNAISSDFYTNHYFDGIYPTETLIYTHRKPELIISNIYPSYEHGQHGYYSSLLAKCEILGLTAKKLSLLRTWIH